MMVVQGFGAPRLVEGVTYFRFAVRFRLADGTRRCWYRWSAGFPWVREETAREIETTFGHEGVRPNSIRIKRSP